MIRRKRSTETRRPAPPTTVREIMTTAPVTVPPDASVARIAELMDGRAISGLPVTNASRKLLGIVTDADLVSRNTRIEAPPITALAEDGSVAELPADFRARLRHKVGTRAKDVMTAKVFTVGPDEDVETLAQVMVKHGINMIPVVEKDRLVGVASRADVIRWMTRKDWPSVRAS
jgi:CBS domain-containing protein